MNEYNIQEEVWKDVVGFEGYYQVSCLGMVRSVDRLLTYSNGKIANHKGRVLRYTPDKQGYLKVGLNKNDKVVSRRIHRLVATAFIDNELLKREVNHIDGNKQNNTITNLEWCTPSENNIHAIKTGLRTGSGNGSHEGEKNGRSKLSESDVVAIREMRSKGIVYREIAKIFSISTQQAWGVAKGKYWGRTK